uniref:Phosphotransferase n=3 Tax=Cacopsylla melanoneura TaxID=428564 RepID=A0A8D9FAD2_9HEMI
MSRAVVKRLWQLNPSDEALKDLMARLEAAINIGLNEHTHSDAAVKCYPTYVQDFPEGDETGKFLGLDIGGSKFRVLMISCTRDGCETHSEIYPISQSLLDGPGVVFFDYVAQCLADFVKKQDVERETLDLGLTFGFPVNQTGLAEGVLVTWTKGFNCECVEGKDVVAMLREALSRQKIMNINIVALSNDTTGCLMSCAYEHPDCKIGVILGTGFNACYVEESDKVPIFNNVNKKPFVIVNTEWGDFGKGGSLDFLLTEFDWTIDDTSSSRFSFIYEKLVAGFFMGELVRVIMAKLTQEGLILNGKGSKQLSKEGIITLQDIFAVESSAKGDLSTCRNLLYNRLGLPHATAQDCIDMHYICTLVSMRSAHLASAGVACLISRTNFNPITVGLDGSLYRHHPFYSHWMMAKVPALLDASRKVNLVLAHDGSGRGAAFVSAAFVREEERQRQREIEEALERARQKIEEERLRQEEIERRRALGETMEEDDSSSVTCSDSDSDSCTESSTYHAYNNNCNKTLKKLFEFRRK